MTEQENREEQQGTILDNLHEGVAQEAEPALQFVLKHIKAIGGVIVAIVAIVACYGVYDYNAKSALASAQLELGDIVVNKNAAERVSMLEAFIANAPDAVKQSARFELVNACLAQKDYTKAVSVWEAIAANSNADVAVVAELGKADALTMAGDTAGAIAAYEALEASVHEDYKPVVQMALAPVAEKAGQLDRALALYESLQAKQKGDGYFAHKIAMLRAQLGQNG